MQCKPLRNLAITKKSMWPQVDFLHCHNSWLNVGLSVATGFPAGQTPLKTRLEEIRYAVEKGANEIDIVIDRSLVLTGQWEELYREIQQMKEACGLTHMKAILATGELDTLNNVRVLGC